MNIYLIGFMGAGKTTVGRLLAEKLDLPFVDLDDVIEKKTDLTIPMIFEKHGENYFRQLEADCLQRIAQYSGNIIATGGGIILSIENRKIMKNTGITIYLKWRTNILYQRIKNGSSRPIINSIDEDQLYQHIEKVMLERQLYYKTADYIIQGDEQTSPEDTVEMIQRSLLQT